MNNPVSNTGNNIGKRTFSCASRHAQLDQPLTSNPNVGGFGQGDAEIVLQDPFRVQGLLFFLASVILAQIFN